MIRQLIPLVLFVTAIDAAPASAQTPIVYEPKAGVQTFAVRPPVLRLKPGAIVETRTFSQRGDYYEKAGGRWPGEVGPFFIEGATPGDTLVVKIVKLRPNRDTAVSALLLNVFVFARQYDAWVEQASSAVLVGTLLSVVTLTSVMWMVKTGHVPALLFR